MQIAVCDDSSIDRRLIAELLECYFKNKPVECRITEYCNGIDLLSDFQEGRWFDIVFLDIFMNHLLGMEVARRLRNMKYAGGIVFLTATPDYAVESYDVDAAGYLLKPNSYEKLSRIMDRLTLSYDAKLYHIRRRSSVLSVPYAEILFAESNNAKCILHRTGQRSYTVYKRLDEIEQELNDRRFLRCHQSFLVNMDHIRRADKQFELFTGDVVQVRQRDVKAIRRAYLDYAAHNGICPDRTQ